MKKKRDIKSNYCDLWSHILKNYIINGDSSEPKNLDDIIEEILPMFRLAEDTTVEDVFFRYLKYRVTIDINGLGLSSLGDSQFIDAEYCDSVDMAKAIWDLAKAKPEAGNKYKEKIAEKLLRNQSNNFRFDLTTGQVLDPATYESVMEELEKIERRKAAEE